MPQRPTPRPRRPRQDPSRSMRPKPRPSTREEREAGERGNRAARRGDMTRRELEAGMKKGGKVRKRQTTRRTTDDGLGGQMYVRGDSGDERRATVRRTIGLDNESMPRGAHAADAYVGGIRASYNRGPTTSPRPTQRPRNAERKAYGGKMKAKKMAKGGMCRGMGAASRGGKYKSS